jgi:hypothetical protein
MHAHDPRYSDAAHRAADLLTAAFVDGLTGGWIALRLSDGGSDGKVYVTRRGAVVHQLHQTQCAYAQVMLGGMSPKEAQAFLDFNRGAYDQGFRMSDPEDPEPVRPLSLY